MENKRKFYVDTPLGKIKVWANHDYCAPDKADNPDDFPGVYIDFIPNGKRDCCEDKYMVAVVEYDSCQKCIQTCVYQPSDDAPVAIIKREVE